MFALNKKKLLIRFFVGFFYCLLAIGILSPHMSAAGPTTRPYQKRTEKKTAKQPFLLSQKDTSPIQILNTDVLLYQGHRIIHEGNVRLKKGKMSLTCDTLILTLDQQDQNILSAAATGFVKVSSGNQWALCKRAFFNETAGALILTGKPELHQGNSILHAKKIIYNFQQGSLKAYQVTGVFHIPPSTNNKKKKP